MGLTGGIGAGKSTVAAELSALGAVVVDADQIAREVVEPGTDGLAEVVAAFGEDVLDDEGRLDRPALGRIVFADDEARTRLNGILHPRIGARTAELIAGAPDDAVVVHDVPLLVENGMGPAFALVVVVDAPEDVRVARLAETRGMPEDDARARIRAQATEEARRAAADVWIDNVGDVDAVHERVRALWSERIVPFEAALRAGEAAPWPTDVVDPDPIVAGAGPPSRRADRGRGPGSRAGRGARGADRGARARRTRRHRPPGADDEAGSDDEEAHRGTGRCPRRCRVPGHRRGTPRQRRPRPAGTRGARARGLRGGLPGARGTGRRAGGHEAGGAGPGGGAVRAGCLRLVSTFRADDTGTCSRARSTPTGQSSTTPRVASQASRSCPCSAIPACTVVAVVSARSAASGASRPAATASTYSSTSSSSVRSPVWTTRSR